MSLTRWGPPRPPNGADADALFLRYWLFWVTLGGAAGALAPAVAQLLLAGAPVRAPLMIAAGAVEGAALGWTQATVLRVRVPALSRARWVRATALGAAVVWFLALLPAEWAAIWQRWPVAWQTVAAVVGGTVLLSVIGIAQRTELRRHSRAAGWWILGNAAAWCAGLLVFAAVAAGLWKPGQPTALVVLIGVLAGILLMLTTALVSGVILLRILPTKSPRQPV
jgi:hypothetical protein